MVQMTRYIVEVFDWKELEDANKFLKKMFKRKLKVWDAGAGSDTYALVAGKKKPNKKDLDGYYGLEGMNPFKWPQITKLLDK